jgi:hypothetical protein
MTFVYNRETYTMDSNHQAKDVNDMVFKNRVKVSKN